MPQHKYNAGDESQVEAQNKKQETIRKQELEDIKAILSRPEGIRFFKRLFREGRIWSTTFTGNSQSFFLEGHRNLALMFFGDVVVTSPDKIPQLMMEGSND